jgi:hypothetical protein
MFVRQASRRSGTHKQTGLYEVSLIAIAHSRMALLCPTGFTGGRWNIWNNAAKASQLTDKIGETYNENEE